MSHILQGLVFSLWRDPSVAKLISGASATYSARRQELLDRLRDRGIHASGASGLNVWIGVGEEAGAVGALLERGWVVAPGAPYRLNASPPAIRVTIATLLEDEAGRLAADVADVLTRATASRSG